MSNGYDPRLLAIDDQMVALGRPPPPVVSWISGGFKGDFNAATAQWRERLAQWEGTQPDNAARWLELREQYIEIDRALESAKWSSSEWLYRVLINQGCSPRIIDAIRRDLDDRSCMKAARDWVIDGTQWSFIVSGRPGCGKSTAAAWCAHQLAMRTFKPLWVRCVSMVDKPMFGFEAQLEKSKCQDAGVLVLDDIGAGAREETAKAWLGWLDDVLDFRHGRRRKTVITTNLPLVKLRAWLGPRLVDRLREGAEHETAERSMRGAR